MPSDRPRATEYLWTILSSSARPFGYRSRTHRLLGITPPSGASCRFQRPLVPPAFRYMSVGTGDWTWQQRSNPWTDVPAVANLGSEPPATGSGEELASPPDPDAPLKGRNEPARRPTRDVDPRDADGIAAPRSPATGRPLPPEPRARAEHSPQHGSRPKESKGSPGPEPAPAETTEAEKRSIGGPEAASGKAGPPDPAPSRVVVPGLTEPRSILAALSARLAQQDGPAGTDETITESNRESRPRPGPPPPAGGSERTGSEPAFTGVVRRRPRTDAPDLSARSGDVRGGAPSPATIPSPETPLRRPAEDPGPYPRLGSGERVLDRIGQLRQAVIRLAAKGVAREPDNGRKAREAEARKKPAPETPPPPPGRPRPAPTMATESIPSRRTTRAFWSSSVLRSSHLRRLR